MSHEHEHEHEHEHGLHSHVHEDGSIHSHSHDHDHGHVHENQKAVVNRLARAIGHLEKVKSMVEEGYDCSEVLVQLSAVRSALNNTGKIILEDHLRHCIVEAVEDGDRQSIDDLCDAIRKFMK
ncbi:MAG: metal-sensing transcriptional repressor [Oscillospiraceae bacterium]|nr:metal-sensing transcriptional repressor [Oscillospiraceae bacterium]